MEFSFPRGHRQTMGTSLPPLETVTGEKEEADRATSPKFVCIGSKWSRKQRSQWTVEHRCVQQEQDQRRDLRVSLIQKRGAGVAVSCLSLPSTCPSIYLSYLKYVSNIPPELFPHYKQLSPKRNSKGGA